MPARRRVLRLRLRLDLSLGLGLGLGWGLVDHNPLGLDYMRRELGPLERGRQWLVGLGEREGERERTLD